MSQTILGSAILQEISHSEFSPLPWCSSGWAQTIASQYWPETSKPLRIERTHLIALDGKNRLALTEYSPNAAPSKPWVVLLVHGLNGSYRSPYMQRLSRKFTERGARCFCMHLRNCGPGLGLAFTSYHAGQSDDFHKVFAWLRRQFPDQDIFAIGISLGGNILLKALGEASFDEGLFAAAISPPANLLHSSARMRFKRNRLFDLYFSYRTAKEYQTMKKYLTNPPSFRWSFKKTLYDFDDAITAPQAGFPSADEYYLQSSSIRFLGAIRTSTLILTAMDDPVISSEDLLTADCSESVELLVTQNGGHVGYLCEDRQHLRWMDSVLLHWIAKKRDVQIQTENNDHSKNEKASYSSSRT